MQHYNIQITDSAGNTCNVRIKMPIYQFYVNQGNSSWFADGGKLKYASGYCNSWRQPMKPWWLKLMNDGVDGVTLWDFFSVLSLHNTGGTGVISSGWASNMVPGRVQWIDTD